MESNKKGFLIIILAFVVMGISFLLYKNNLVGYSIFTIAIAVVLFLFGIYIIINFSSPTKIYNSNVKYILNTFDSILVQSSSVPNFEDRNIIEVQSMDDLIDAQLEIRKPICYMKQTESCSFVLLDEKEAYVYVEKLNKDVISPVEIAIDEIRHKKTNEQMDSEMLRDIDKTTIIKLSNKKSYKVSPVRKKEKKDDIEVL